MTPSRRACRWQLGLLLLAASALPCAATVTSAQRVEAKSPLTLAQEKQQLAQQQAQVGGLQQAVSKQESTSRQASDRLQQQDQAIARMQQELQTLHPAPAAGQR